MLKKHWPALSVLIAVAALALLLLVARGLVVGVVRSQEFVVFFCGSTPGQREQGYYRRAKEQLDVFLAEHGITPTRVPASPGWTGPTYRYGPGMGSDSWYEDSEASPGTVFVRVHSPGQLSAEILVSVYSREWAFPWSADPEDQARIRQSELGEWWREYKANNPVP